MIALELVLRFLAVIIATEAITELAVKSEFFEPVRRWLFEHGSKVTDFLHKIFDCGYCFSVWAGLFMTLIAFAVDYIFVDFFIIAIVVHRLSNIFHFIVDRVDANKG